MALRASAARSPQGEHGRPLRAAPRGSNPIANPTGVGLNPYAYANNSPIDWVDRNGLSPTTSEQAAEWSYACIGLCPAAAVGAAYLSFSTGVSIGSPAAAGAGSSVGAVGGGAPLGGWGEAVGPGASIAGATIKYLVDPNLPAHSSHRTAAKSIHASPSSVQQGPTVPATRSSGAEWGPGRPHLDPLADRSRFAGAEYAINRSLFGPGGRDLLAAANIALNFWGVRVPGVSVGKLPAGRIAETSYFPDTGAVHISFDPDPAKTTSARQLLSTAHHEGVSHVGQFRSGNYASPPKTGFYVNEIEALDAELGMAERIGLSSSEIRDLQILRADAYQELIGTPYQGRVDAGNYQLF